MAWHKGEWKPLYVPQWYNPKVSQHPFDPYSFTHISHGLLLYYVWKLLFGLRPEPGGFFATLTFETTWEVIENSEFVINRYRETSGTSHEYEGDSFQNVVGDLTACQTGYLISWFFDSNEIPWMTLLLYLTSELVLLAFMRDSLALTFITLLYPIEKITRWQEEGVNLARIQDRINGKRVKLKVRKNVA